MKLLFATGNEYKYLLMKDRLKNLKDIEIVIPKMLGISINVIEDGITPEKNAIKKATSYYNELHMPVIAEDSALYIDKFSESDQPGLFVKRVNGKENLTDEEILDYYIQKLNEYGGESLAGYHTGVCLIDEEGNISSKTIEETKFLLTTKLYDGESKSGGVLEPLSYDLLNKKYFTERTEEDKKRHYEKLDEEYKNLVKNKLLAKKKVTI